MPVLIFLNIDLLRCLLFFFMFSYSEFFFFLVFYNWFIVEHFTQRFFFAKTLAGNRFLKMLLHMFIKCTNGAHGTNYANCGLKWKKNWTDKILRGEGSVNTNQPAVLTGFLIIKVYNFRILNNFIFYIYFSYRL